MRKLLETALAALIEAEPLADGGEAYHVTQSIQSIESALWELSKQEANRSRKGKAKSRVRA
jgi:hypothetical protein